MKLLLAALTVCFACTSLAELYIAQVFKWVDANGQVHFSDQPPERAEAQKLDVKAIESYNEVSIEPLGFGPSGAVTANKVTIYTTTRCEFCLAAKRHMDRRGIAYVDKNVERSTTAQDEHKQLGGTGVPLIVVRNHIMKGFDAERFDALWQRTSFEQPLAPPPQMPDEELDLPRQTITAPDLGPLG